VQDDLAVRRLAKLVALGADRAAALTAQVSQLGPPRHEIADVILAVVEDH
jgi:hypothetical protein